MNRLQSPHGSWQGLCRSCLAKICRDGVPANARWVQPISVTRFVLFGESFLEMGLMHDGLELGDAADCVVCDGGRPKSKDKAAGISESKTLGF